MYIINLPDTLTDTSLPTLQRDQLLDGAGGGVRFLFDLAFPFSWPTQAAPADGDTIVDVVELANGVFVKDASETIAYNGRGFDFSTMTSTSNTVENDHVRMPTSVWADINTTQYFLLCAYLRLPSNADWNTSATLLPFFASGVSGGYTAEVDPITLAFMAGNIITARRQTSVGAGTILSTAALGVGYQGAFAQVAFWRNATGCALRVQSAAGAVTVTAAAGANNTADFSAVQGKFGIVPPFTQFGTSPEHRTGRNFRLYRGFVENLATSGRDPATVLAADWARVVARGVFT